MPLTRVRPIALSGKLPSTNRRAAFTNYHRTGACDLLHACGQIGRMPDRRILCVRFAGFDRTDHYLTGVHADSNLNGHAAGAKQLDTIAVNFVLRAKPGIKRALRMVLMGSAATRVSRARP